MQCSASLRSFAMFFNLSAIVNRSLRCVLYALKPLFGQALSMLCNRNGLFSRQRVISAVAPASDDLVARLPNIINRSTG